MILQKWLLLQSPTVSCFPWTLRGGNWNPDVLEEMEGGSGHPIRLYLKPLPWSLLCCINTHHNRVFEGYQQPTASRTPLKPICHPLKVQQQGCYQMDRAKNRNVGCDHHQSKLSSLSLKDKSVAEGLRTTYFAGSPWEGIMNETAKWWKKWRQSLLAHEV